MADLGSLLGGAGIGGAIGKAIVSLELDTKKYQAELKAAQAQTQAGASGMGNALATFGGAAKAGVAVAGVAVAAFAVNSIKAASDLGEAVNQSNVVFEDQAKAMEAWAETGAQAFGLSKAAALEAASGFGLMLQAAGLAVNESAKLSQSLVQLAGDLASFKNVDPTVALEKLRGGLAGEAEPLRQFGIFLSEAAVQAKAMELGIGSASEELTDAQKIQARYAIIMEQSTKAQGDFGRTADSLPNQIRSMKAEFTNISAEVGEKLLPVAISLVETLRNLVPALKVVGEQLVLVTGYVSDLTAALTLQGNDFDTYEVKLRTLIRSYADGEVSILEYEQALIALQAQYGFTFNATEGYAEALDRARDAQHATSIQAAQYAHTQEALGGATDEVADSFEGLSRAAKEIKHNLAAEIPAMIGTVTTWKETFTLSSAELVKITESWAKIAKTIAHDLRVIGNSELSPAMREAIAALPPEMRHAWVEGNAKQRRAIQQNIKETLDFADEVPGLARQALAGGNTVGKGLMSGTVKGIIEGSPAVSRAAALAVDNAIDAAKEHAGAESPSKVMRELGLDMMTGLYQGITKGAQKVLDAAVKEIEKLISKIGAELDKVKSKAQSFADSIRSGFSGFADIAGLFGGEEFGTDIGAALQAQVTKASALAATLEALKRQGASQATLAQVAQGGAEFGRAILQGGPELVKEMNQSLATISRLANETGKGLSEHFFGEKIDRLEAKLEKQNEILRDIREIERLGHGHAILLDGQKLGEAVRKELIKIGNRNGDALGPNG